VEITINIILNLLYSKTKETEAEVIVFDKYVIDNNQYRTHAIIRLT